MKVKITFLGAAGTVTGSKYLVEFSDNKILVDCGLFQGDREWREENWSAPRFDFSAINAVLLTHAHIDHTGLLPRYHALGLSCPVFASHATFELCQLLLPDSGRLQEEEAEYRRERGRSRHTPPLPLYTEQDARSALNLFKQINFSERTEILPQVWATWRRTGHILGAGSIVLEIGGKKITFSGDIGRYHVPILKDPEATELGDLVLIESTYGDESHANIDPKQALAEVIKATHARGGVIVIPSFAVGRAQQLLYYLRELKQSSMIPDLPVIVDSPMAADATALYAESVADYDEQALEIVRSGKKPFHVSKLGFTRGREDSIRLNEIKEPMIIISASGMLTGGRILHHLKHRVSDRRNTILFVGHQPNGSKGARLLQGIQTISILGDECPVHARIEAIGALSAHGDQGELLRWLHSCSGSPSIIAVVHGEPNTAQVFAKKLRDEQQAEVIVPTYQQQIEL